MIVALPAALAVTIPEELMLAILVLLVVHVTFLFVALAGVMEAFN